MADWAGELLSMMKEQGVTMPTQLIATVETAPPELTLRYSEQVIPSKQIYCSNYLLPHYHRDYTIDGTVDDIELSLSKMEVNNTTNTSPAGEGPHTHAIPSIKGVEEQQEA